MPPQGLEPGSVSGLQPKELPKPAIQRAAESGAVGAVDGPIDDGLAKIIDAWPELSEEIKRAILGLASPTC